MAANSLGYIEGSQDFKLSSAISDSLDEIQPILDDIQEGVGTANSAIADVKTDVGEVKTNVADVKNDVANVKTTVDEVKTEVTSLAGLGTILDAAVEEVKGLAAVESTIENIDNLLQEVKHEGKETSFKVFITEPLSAFGELAIVSNTPVTQGNFMYDRINEQVFFSRTNGTGTVTCTNSVCELYASTTINSFALVATRRAIKYRPGQGAELRFTAKFSTGAAGFIQTAGAGSVTDSLEFAVKDTTFGVRRLYGGREHTVKLLITTAATGSETATITLNNIPYTVNLTNAGGDKNFTAAQIARATFLGWTRVENIQDAVYFVFDQAVPLAGTFSISSATAAGTFSTIVIGVPTSEEFVAQASWNVDPMDGTGPSGQTLDITKGNVYLIKYQYLGHGMISYYIEDSATGHFCLVHKNTYANTYTTPSLRIPSFSLRFASRNVSAVSGSVTMGTVSCYGGIAGPVRRLDPRGAASSEKSISSNTETNVMVLRNGLLCNSFPNNSEFALSSLSIASDGSKSVTIRIYATTQASTIGAPSTSDYPNYSYFDALNSIVLIDTNSITRANCILILTFTLAKVESRFLDLNPLDIIVTRASSFIVTAQSTQSSTVTAAVSWVEDI